jgi:hypothetical protein
VILDLLLFAKARHADCAQYLLSLPRPWCDKRSRSAWRVVHDASKLERHVARLTAALVDPVLERKLAPAEDVRALAARMDAEATAREAQTQAEEAAHDSALDPPAARDDVPEPPEPEPCPTS